MKRKYLTLATMITGLTLSSVALAEHSNRDKVRESLAKGEWRVIWGKNFTEADWIRGFKAIGESIATENPGPFLAWFGEVLDANFQKMQANLQGVARADLERWVLQSLKQKQIISYKGFLIEAGFATFDRWDRFVYDEPRTRKVKQPLPLGGWTWSVESYTERVERKVNLPNWHQFYIRYQLIPGGQTTGGGGLIVGSSDGSTTSFVQAVGSVWTYANGEFRNTGAGQWQEYQGGADRFRFKETGRTPSSVTLHDGSRGITVKLTNFKAFVTRGSENVVSYNGGWKWQEWSFSNGQGKFVQTAAGQWAEYQNGQMKFTFTETVRGANEVNLYNASRSISVRLGAQQAVVARQGNTLLTIQGGWHR